MEKYLLQIEFRYKDVPKNEDESARCITDTVTLGVFDTRDEANVCGNRTLELFETKFKLNPNYNIKERFSNNGGCFGYPNDLITDLTYLQTPFSFFAKIVKLKYKDIEEVINNAVHSTARYREYMNHKNE